ncbi:WXG100 family type VII secretion target [Mesorhizobium japonicum]|uniref:WXG100 family type VII secretion target n=1 Tax=Mesorhizobium japonicum TaxID=2066070 RepID=UPI003B5B6B11
MALDIEYARMHDVAAALTGTQSDVEAKLADLQRQVDDLVAEGYVTDASSTEFAAVYRELSDGIAKTVEGMSGLAGFLTKAASTFRETDQKLAKSLKSDN